MKNFHLVFLMFNGLKAIEDIEVGDEVLAYDEETGQQGYKPVVRLFRNKTQEWQQVYIDGMEEPIISTPGHKYYLPENKECREIEELHEHIGYELLSNKWVSARNLKVGDKVLLSDGKYGIIIKTQATVLSEAEPTYNFEVADYHTYYVSKSGVCVHNRCSSKNVLDNINYTDKVKGQMLQDIDHGFPKMIDDIAGVNGNIGSFVGGDGVIRTAVELPGAINGRVGIYQYIIEPNGITINHRLFTVIGKSLLGG